jgi:hypothetical protein
MVTALPTVTASPLASATTPTSSALTITASGGGVTQMANVTLNISPATNAARIILPTNLTVALGQFASFPVSLSAPAGAGGIFVTLCSSDTTKVTVWPSNILIPAGATTPLQSPQMTATNFGSAVITASAPGLQPASQTVQATGTIRFSPGSISLSPSAYQSVFVILAAPAPANGLTINLISDNPAVAALPATVTFQGGATALGFQIRGVGAGSTLIHASAPPNIADTTASVTVSGPAPLTVTTASLRSGQVGVLYSQAIVAAGGTAPYSWAVTAGALPGGLTLNPATGQISGTPSAAVTNTPLTFQVTDSSVPVQNAAASFTLTIAPASVAPGSITMMSGGGQATAINTAFVNPLVATVKDSGGNPIGGVTVTFSTPATRASASFGGAVNTAVTNSAGMAASATLTANAIAGTFAITATAPGVSVPASFTLTNTLGAPASLAVTSGSGQSATINGPFTNPLVATVRDSGGNAVPGITVTFTAPSTGAGGSFTGGANTAVTNGAGVATSAIFTANGVAGTYAVNASVPSVVAPASFSLTNVTGIVLPPMMDVGVGQSAPFPVTLSSPAPPSGVVLTLTSSDSTKVTVSPANVLIPAGATTPRGAPQVTGVDFGSAAITVSASGLPATSQTVRVISTVGTVGFSPTSMSLSLSTWQPVYLTLSTPAPANGLTINLSSDNPAVATVPATATFPPGSIAVRVAVTGVSTGSTLIHANALPNIADATASVTVN